MTTTKLPPDKIMLPKPGEIPTPEKNIFFSLIDDANQIDKLLEKDNIVFIRAAVASGKTTMARFLADHYENYVFIKDPVEDPAIDDYHLWSDSFLTAHRRLGLDEAPNKLPDLLTSFAHHGKTLVIDEAHLTFANTSLLDALYKQTPEGLKIVLFSASGETCSNKGKLRKTPASITCRLIWRPKIPDVADITQQLRRDHVTLDEESVSFLFNLCTGHFDMMMVALRWVQTQQLQGKTEDERQWKLKTTMQRVRSSWDVGWHVTGSFLHELRKSRAVRANGPYADEREIPSIFRHILFSGPTKLKSPQDRRDLTVAGLLLPEEYFVSKDTNFVSVDWADNDTRYRVAQPILCQYYQHKFQELGFFANIKPKYTVPDNCLDLLALITPFLSFESVVFPPLLHQSGEFGGGLNTESFPHEAHFITAMKSQFMRQGFRVNDIVDNVDGEPDIVMQRLIPEGYRHGLSPTKQYVLELALTGFKGRQGIRYLRDHLSRFWRKKNYSDIVAHKCLLIIGRDKSAVTTHLPTLYKENKNEDVEILGLVVSPAFFSHTIFMFDGNELLSFDIPVDFVARVICTDDTQQPLRSASQLATTVYLADDNEEVSFNR